MTLIQFLVCLLVAYFLGYSMGKDQTKEKPVRLNHKHKGYSTKRK